MWLLNMNNNNIILANSLASMRTKQAAIPTPMMTPANHLSRQMYVNERTRAITTPLQIRNKKHTMDDIPTGITQKQNPNRVLNDIHRLLIKLLL